MHNFSYYHVIIRRFKFFDTCYHNNVVIFYGCHGLYWEKHMIFFLIRLQCTIFLIIMTRFPNPLSLLMQNMYKCLHVQNSIKPEKLHNDKFWNDYWNSSYDALAQNPVLKTTPYMLPQNAKSPWPLNIHGTLSKR